MANQSKYESILNYNVYTGDLDDIPLKDSVMRINTLNPHSYNVSKSDPDFKVALSTSDILIPDGIGIVIADLLINNNKIKKIAGADLFHYEMSRLNKFSGKCFFLGSTNETLNRIEEKAKNEFPNVTTESYSPPFKTVFTDKENDNMISKINIFQPDVLFIGMTAPKQEKWAYQHYRVLRVNEHICCIGAVFDFYAGTINRAPNWMIKIGMEWFFRLVREPKRMWRRYLLGNVKFIISIFNEKIFGK